MCSTPRAGSVCQPEAVTVRWRAPGRVNLLGEHTDYNEGLALPFAIEQACVAKVSHGSALFAVSSAQVSGTVSLEPSLVHRLPSLNLEAWARYVLGPVWVLLDAGYDVPPLDIKIDSDVPVGAGLSSSAALVCSVLGAIADLLDLELGPDQLLELSRRVEHDVVGVPTGGLDQLATLRCTEGHVLFCDFTDLSTEQVSFDPGARGLAVLAVDTHAPHRLVDGQYAARREGCARAAAALGVKSLREVDDLDGAMAGLDDEEQRRYVRHVVTENARVLPAVGLLRAGEIEGVGALLSASHDSLRDDYRVTVPELDVAAATLMESGALGARMTGGGFGGCVIALLDRDGVSGAVAEVEKAFAGKGFRPPSSFTVHPSAGASRL